MYHLFIHSLLLGIPDGLVGVLECVPHFLYYNGQYMANAPHRIKRSRYVLAAPSSSKPGLGLEIP